MLITKASFRMSFFGGGTDMPSFFNEYGGAVISTTFDKNIKFMTNNRNKTIDILKGIGIILVVLGHVFTTNPLRDWIYSFHMPMFFLFSGLFFSPEKFSFVKQIKRILVPYFSFGVITYLYWRFIELRFREIPDDVDINFHFFDLFFQQNAFYFNVALWFLPCLFLCQLLSFFIFNVIKSNIAIISLCLVWVLSFVFCQPYFDLMWVNQLLYSCPLFIFGSLVGRKLSCLDDYIVGIKPVCKYLFFIPLIVLFLIPNNADMHMSLYPHGYCYFYLIALVSIFSLYIISFMFVNTNWLIGIGA